MSTGYWFPAKRYGWGWSFPITWQGWAVFAAFLLLIFAGAFIFPPRTSLVMFITYVALLSLALIAVCWWKGEPPCWRWGQGD
jgi:hypothetical protein